MPEPESQAPPVSLGHLVLSVANLKASRDFYAAFGLRPLGGDDALSIFELRGGTHLLLFQRGGPAEDGPASPLDQKPSEAVDLMITGRGFADLDAFRGRLIEHGVQPDPIPDRRYFGHYVFKAKDPDGNEVTVSTSHASDQPI